LSSSPKKKDWALSMGVKQYVDMSDDAERDKIKCSLDFVLNTIPFETE